MSIISKIPDLSDNELSQLFSNVMDALSRGEKGKVKAKKIEEAEEVKQAIEKEWQRRRELAEKGEYKAERPETGMLATMGYRVGNEGVSLAKRQQILAHIVTGVLPFVQSPAYMHQWDAPHSPERLSKLAETIAYLCQEKINFNDESLAKAILEWKADLDWLYSEYYISKGYNFKWPRVYLRD